MSNAFFAFAQKTGSITGRVIDSDNLALPYANIQVESSTKGSVTDLNGYFVILGLKPGFYELTVSYIGFLPQKQTVEVIEGKTQSVDFVMQPGIELQEIIVEGSMKGQAKALNAQRNSSNIVNVISSDQNRTLPPMLILGML